MKIYKLFTSILFKYSKYINIIKQTISANIIIIVITNNSNKFILYKHKYKIQNIKTKHKNKT